MTFWHGWDTEMGYSIWDRDKGGPASRKRYLTHYSAAKACQKLNDKHHAIARFYVKGL